MSSALCAPSKTKLSRPPRCVLLKCDSFSARGELIASHRPTSARRGASRRRLPVEFRGINRVHFCTKERGESTRLGMCQSAFAEDERI